MRFLYIYITLKGGVSGHSSLKSQCFSGAGEWSISHRDRSLVSSGPTARRRRRRPGSESWTRRRGFSWGLCRRSSEFFASVFDGSQCSRFSFDFSIFRVSFLFDLSLSGFPSVLLFAFWFPAGGSWLLFRSKDLKGRGFSPFVFPIILLKTLGIDFHPCWRIISK